jgi:hypothetical protein
VENQSLEMIAGFGSSLIFILSNFPMVAKAVSTRNLKSYSFTQILMANVGNLLYWLYVVGLPLGPIWFLHGFNTAVSILMLTLYLWFEVKPGEVLAQHLALVKGAHRLTAVSLLLHLFSRK